MIVGDVAIPSPTFATNWPLAPHPLVLPLDLEASLQGMQQVVSSKGFKEACMKSLIASGNGGVHECLVLNQGVMQG
jgi:hypothetical protein